MTSLEDRWWCLATRIVIVMFTGIIEAIGEVVICESRGGDVRLRVKTNELDLREVQLGDSIATNGVCLTVVDLPGDGYVADVSAESLAMTSIGDWSTGTLVNLERALTPKTRLGGHLAAGVMVGGVLQLAIQIPTLRRIGCSRVLGCTRALSARRGRIRVRGGYSA